VLKSKILNLPIPLIRAKLAWIHDPKRVSDFTLARSRDLDPTNTL